MQICEVTPCGELQERVHCSEPDIAAAHRVVPISFQVIEEAGQELWIEVRQL